MGPDQQARGPVATKATHPSPVAKPAFRRQTSKVGAGCGNAARPVLCGGCPVMGIPTAIVMSVPPVPNHRDGKGAPTYAQRSEWRQANGVARRGCNPAADEV